MQRQAWKERSTADKLSSRDHHRAILQEAVGLVFENRRHEMKELGGTTVDDIQIATAILSELQESQDIQSRLISSLPNKVTNNALLLYIYLFIFFIRNKNNVSVEFL